MVFRAGYTSAVDMWAVGCLTTSLFLGQSYFAPTLSGQYTRRSSVLLRAAAAECDLSKIDHALEWISVEPHAKDFIKTLLRLDENERPTATQAISNPWFSANRSKGSSLGFYEDLIRDWKPERPAEDLAENLRMFIEAGIPENDV